MFFSNLRVAWRHANYLEPALTEEERDKVGRAETGLLILFVFLSLASIASLPFFGFSMEGPQHTVNGFTVVGFVPVPQTYTYTDSPAMAVGVPIFIMITVIMLVSLRVVRAFLIWKYVSRRSFSVPCLPMD